MLGAVAAGGLVETFDDVQDRLDLAPLLETRGLFALTVNGDSMVEAHIADGDVVLLEPVVDPLRLKEGTIVSALVPGSGTTLKHFHRAGSPGAAGGRKPQLRSDPGGCGAGHRPGQACGGMAPGLRAGPAAV
jgi:hypothetical protein